MSNVQSVLTDKSTEIGHLPVDVLIPILRLQQVILRYDLSSNIDCNVCVVLAACFVYDGVDGRQNGRHAPVGLL